MSKTSQYLTLKSIVNQYIDRSGQLSANFRRLYSIGVAGAEDLGMDIFGVPKTCKLTVNANKTVDLPDDYIQWSKVGVLNGYGEVATLKYNNDLSSFGIGDYGRLTENTDGSMIDYGKIWQTYYLNYMNGGTGYRLLGIPSGKTDIGTFKVNQERGVILLDNNFEYGYIILEYLASQCNEQDYFVPIQCREALIAFIAWKDVEFMGSNRKFTTYDIRNRERNYYAQRRIARARMQPLRISVINDIIRDGQMLAIKS